jgi:thioredoxin-disulfide reductase
MEIYNLIIIGGGPAGITAGIYAARQQMETLLITKEFGGKLGQKTIAIENYPGFEQISGLELSQRFEKQVRKQKIDIEKDEAVEVKKSGERFFILTGSKNRFEAKSVIIASGGDPRPLEVPGEKEFIGKGVSYCTACDGPLFSDKTVAVVGGGDSGLEAALFLSKIAKKVYILEYAEKIAANMLNRQKVEKIKNIEIITNAALQEIRGENFVHSLVYKDRLAQKQKTLEVEGIFIEIGYQPATSFVKGLVDFDKRDQIKIDVRTCETSVPGLFAAGDVTDFWLKQIVVAAAQGAKAAMSSYRYLQELK